MAPLVILVEFLVKPEFASKFGKLIAANAKASVEREPGCRRFDVLQSPAEPRDFWLYEIYDDEAAFDFHLKTRHFKAFAAAIEGQIEQRSLWRLGFNAGSPKPKSKAKAAAGPKARSPKLRKKTSKTARKVK
jgi:quinol monooxygenase YgiN